MKKIAMIFLTFIILLVGIMSTMFMSITAVSLSLNNTSLKNNANLPEVCYEFIPSINTEISKTEGLNEMEHLPVLLAIMAQESGCNAITTPDVFQSSESLGLPRNTLDTTASIKQGVAYFGENIRLVNEKQLKDIKIAVQSYNYGIGFVSFMKDNHQEMYTQDWSNKFEIKMGGNYGDSKYVLHVYKYLEETSPIGAGGTFKVLPLVSNSIRAMQPYGAYNDGSGSHWGIDITGGYGTIVVSVDDGVVVMVHGGNCPDGEGYASSCGGGYGNAVTIKHPNGLYTRYGHMAPGSITVNEGQQVSAGDKLGLQGDSGSSTAPHLHFEVRIADGFTHSDTRNPHDYITIPYIN